MALLAALEEFAIEASIAKVAGSEALDFVLDENVQIHGGNGYVRDYPAERHYRDARVNRIFEGTNEINRLLIPGMLMKRALKGELALIPAAKRLMDEVMSPAAPSLDAGDGGPLDAEARAVEAFKKVALLGLGAAMQRFGAKLQDEQEVLLWLADLAIDTYAAESAVLRAQAAAGSADAASHEDAARTFVSDASIASRDDGSTGPRRHRRRRRAPDKSGGASPPAQDRASRHRRGAAPPGRCHRAAGRVRVCGVMRAEKLAAARLSADCADFWIPGAGRRATAAANAAGR